jgi:hypothetical protein
MMRYDIKAPETAQRSAGKVTLTADTKRIAARDDAEQQASLKGDGLGREEGEEQFSQCNTLLCGRILDSCCT